MDCGKEIFHRKETSCKEEKDIEDKYFAGEDNVYPTNYIDMSKLQKLQGIAVRDFSGEVALGNAESNIGNKTKIINTGFATLMDMDTIPFVYEDFHLFEHKILYYETSRGCPFCCSYCLSSVDKTVRFRSLPIVKKSWMLFLKQKFHRLSLLTGHLTATGRGQLISGVIWWNMITALRIFILRFHLICLVRKS